MIKRYDMERTDYDCVEMVECNNGEYVTFEDYDILCGEYDTLKDKYEALVAKIHGVYMEA